MHELSNQSLKHIHHIKAYSVVCSYISDIFDTFSAILFNIYLMHSWYGLTLNFNKNLFNECLT